MVLPSVLLLTPRCHSYHFIDSECLGLGLFRFFKSLRAAADPGKENHDQTAEERRPLTAAGQNQTKGTRTRVLIVLTLNNWTCSVKNCSITSSKNSF